MGDHEVIARFNLSFGKQRVSLADRARDARQWDLAARLYRKALDRNPRNPAIWVQYGHALKESGELKDPAKLSRAEAAYREAVSLNPSIADTYLQLGHVLKLQGKKEAGQASYLRAFVLGRSLSPAVRELSGLGWSEAQIAELQEVVRADAKTHTGVIRSPEASLPLSFRALTEDARRATEPAWSGHFDAEWYLRRNPDVARSGMDPLEHFLLHGLKEGRKPNAEEAKEVWNPNSGETKSPFVSVTDAKICCLINPSFGDEVALFVTHSPNGWLKPHVSHYLASLKRQGIAVVLIVVADQAFLSGDSELTDVVDGIFVRQNEGYDFAAWTHVLRLHPELFDAKILYLLNDSLIGPTNDVAFANLLSRLRESPADVIGLTDNFERGWHISSYFLAFKPRALSSVALHKFLNDIVSFRENVREEVISRYEIRFAPTLKAAGLHCEALFPARDDLSPTVFHWKELLERGFPFVKLMTIRDHFPGVDASDWRELLAAQGYDVSLAERTLAEAKTTADPGNLSPPMTLTQRLPSLSKISSTLGNRVQVAFIGPWNYNNGLGVASRGYMSALRRSGLPINFYPIKRPFHVHQQISPAVDICDFSGVADVAIVHLNPEGWSELLSEAETAVIEDAKVRVGLWVWEMEQIPRNWYPVFNFVDAIWAPSRYCADTFAASAKVPVHVIPHVVTVPPSATDMARVAALRQSLAADERIILYAFDGSSYLARKNPFALVRAFDRSGLAGTGWRLILKTKHLQDSPAQGARLRQAVERTEGVVLVDRSFDKTAMDNLMRAADIFASPHCSEGFGLTIAEAMALGKIVVATDYGGSRDFLDAKCGFPVRYNLQSPDEDHGHYTQEGGVWAQVDEAHLAEMLIEASELVVAGDRRLGEAGCRRIADLLSPAVVGARMRESISQLLQ
jgi:glycosyltransferase involved in cell wall biosynthesis/Tfp pilus assembly protein PilF